MNDQDRDQCLAKYTRGKRTHKNRSEFLHNFGLLREVLTECATRTLSGSIAQPDPKPKEIRRSFIAKTGSEMVPNTMTYSTSCGSCGRVSGSKTLLNVTGSPDEPRPYITVHELISYALAVVDAFSGERSINCSRCDAEMSALVDFHSYIPNVRADLVVRVIDPRVTPFKNYQLLWMTLEGDYRHVTIDEIPLSDSHFTSEQVVHAAKICLKQNDLEGCAQGLKLGLKKFPISRAFIDIAFDLIETSKIGLAEAIAENHIQHYPNDSVGHTCLAWIYLFGYTNTKGQATDFLPMAEQMVDKALSIEKTKEALLIKANCMRLRNLTPDQVAPIFESIISMAPTYSRAYYDYALLWLPYAPQRALQLYVQGGRIAPHDPDFVIGEVRSLIALGRINEANKRLSAAIKMNPSHPFIPALQHKIQAPPARPN